MTARGEARRYLQETVLAYEGDECLTWPYQRTSDGYGLMKLNGSKTTVSRHVCKKTHGAPPTPDHEAAHSCGNGRNGCVTKRHLYWKTHKENEEEKLIHGTRAVGERHGRAKLTKDAVREIRKLSGRVPQKEIGAMFGVSQSAVSLIHLGKIWSLA
ncbi:hypothetical protein ACVJMZ_000339 [Sinorhizobium medicae]